MLLVVELLFTYYEVPDGEAARDVLAVLSR